MNKGLLLIIAIVSLLIGIYFINPYGTATADPRARILGITTYRIASSSMEPTLFKNELILVNAAAYRSHKPMIGDIIVFRYPENRSIDYVFRVAAVSGDRLEIKNGVVYVNDTPLDEPYIKKSSLVYEQSKNFGQFTVPEGNLFVLGDNRDRARDGRYWGFVPYADIIGKVTYVWFSEYSDRVGRVH